MDPIHYRELIIACEACNTVKRFKVTTQEECTKIFREYQCENKCGRNLYSFITVGTIRRE